MPNCERCGKHFDIVFGDRCPDCALAGVPANVLVMFSVRALLHLTCPAGFLIGYFAGIEVLAITCGCLLVADDFISMLAGHLNPGFPIALAIILGLCIKPWYMGVFWSTAAFGILDIPTSIIYLSAPRKTCLAAMAKAHPEMFSRD